MKSATKKRKKWYPFPYRIYRRIRYLRFLKRKRKLIRRDLANTRRQEAIKQKVQMEEHIRVEKRQEKLRIRLEKLQLKKEARIRRQELKREHVDFHEEHQKKLREVKLKSAVDQKHRKKRIRKQMNVYLRASLRNLARSLKPRSFLKAYNNFRSRRKQRRNFYIISLNSTGYFLLSYFVVYMIVQASTIVAALLYHYPTILYYYQLYFNITENQWSHDSVKTIFSAGPLVSLFLGIIFIIIYSRIKEMENRFKLFFLWGFLHLMTMFFGAMLVGTLFDTGLGYVISWMYIMDTGKLLYSIISLFFLVIAGFLVTRSFLVSANSYYNEVTRKNRLSFIFAQILLPFILGNLALIIIRQPIIMYYETYISLTMILMIIPIMVSSGNYPELYFDEQQKKISLSWVIFLILMAVILLYRIGLARGISIG